MGQYRVSQNTPSGALITISGNNLSRVIIGFIHFTYIISICSLKWWKKHVRTMKIKVMADLNQNNDFFYKNLILNLRVGISNSCNSVMNYWLFGHISWFKVLSLIKSPLWYHIQCLSEHNRFPLHIQHNSIIKSEV